MVIDLLEEAAHRLDHAEAVGGLHTGALQPVVEDRVFVGGQVELRGLAHDPHADVIGVAVGEQVVRVVDEAGEAAGDDRSATSSPTAHQKLAGQAAMLIGTGDAAQNPGRDLGNAPGHDGDERAEDEAPGDDGATGLP